MSLITLMILVAFEETLDARPALIYLKYGNFASLVDLVCVKKSIPRRSFMTNGISISVERVLIRSIQKKKLQKYPGLMIERRTVSMAKIKKQVSMK
jgi:hypothetical protein